MGREARVGEWGPVLTPLVALLGGLAALASVPLVLGEPDRRARRLWVLLGLAALVLVLHGELRSDPVIGAGTLMAGVGCSAVLGSLGLRSWSMRRALLAERPRSPDEWTPKDGRRLWTGRLFAAASLAASDGVTRGVYVRVETERWDQGRWRRVSTGERFGERLELAGKTRRLCIGVPRSALRHAAVELTTWAADGEGWRVDPDPDPAALYRSRTLGVPDGASAQVLARVTLTPDAGLSLARVSGHAFSFDAHQPRRLAQRACLLLSLALACATLGLWVSWVR